LSICEIADNSALALLDVSEYKIFLKDTGSGLNEKIHQRLTDDLGTEAFLPYDMGNRLTLLDASWRTRIKISNEGT
jgi:hypothetical protein